MIIRLSSRTGPIPYEFADAPRLIEGDDGHTYYEFTLRNRRARTHATLMLTLEEVQNISSLQAKKARRK